MVVAYVCITGVIMVPLIPILFSKILLNSFYILLTNKRQKYKAENLVQFLVALVGGPFIIPISILVDVLQLPSVLLKDSN